MSCLILSFDQFLLTLDTLLGYLLLMCTHPTNHSQPINNLMFLHRSQIMTFLTSEWPTTTSIPLPSKVEFIMITSTFHGQLFIILQLKVINKGIEISDSIIGHIHISKTLVTVKLQTFPRQVKFGFDNFSITLASNLPSNSTNVNQLAISEWHSTNQLPLVMNDLPLPYYTYTIVAFLTLEFQPQLELFLLLGVE